MARKNKNNKEAFIIVLVFITVIALFIGATALGVSDEMLHVISRYVVIGCFVVSMLFLLRRVKRDRKIRKTDIINLLLFLVLFYMVFK